jgi:hypothetical protein
MRTPVVLTLAGLLVVATGCTGGSADPAEQRSVALVLPDEAGSGATPQR